MSIPRDWIDLFAAFDAHRVEFLVVGGYALALHGRPRFTKDLDLWLGDEPANLSRAEAALVDFGAPDSVLSELRTASLEDVLWMGRPPIRVDLLKGIPGGDFAACYDRRDVVRWETVALPVISRADLIAAKRASGRPQDLIDADALETLG